MNIDDLLAAYDLPDDILRRDASEIKTEPPDTYPEMQAEPPFQPLTTEGFARAKFKRPSKPRAFGPSPTKYRPILPLPRSLMPQAGPVTIAPAPPLAQAVAVSAPVIVSVSSETISAPLNQTNVPTQQSSSSSLTSQNPPESNDSNHCKILKTLTKEILSMELPHYTVPEMPPELGLGKLPVYSCSGCKDTYYFESTLKTHWHRATMVIEYFCQSCQKKLTFHNVCRHQAHMSSHINDKDMVVLNNLSVKTYPGEVVLPEYFSVDDTDYMVRALMEKEGMDPIIPDPGTRKVTVASSGDDGEFSCVECKVLLNTKTDLAKHMQKFESDKFNENIMQCAVCNMYFPSECALNSHNRLHKNEKPNVCPECGLEVEARNIESHVTDFCLHYRRRIRYQCCDVACGKYFSQIASYLHHFVFTHAQSFVRCKLCHEVFDNHKTSEHFGERHNDESPQIESAMYKCKYCSCVHLDQNRLVYHMEKEHVPNIVKDSLRFSFPCMFCHGFYLTGELLRVHISEDHSEHFCSKCDHIVIDSSDIGIDHHVKDVCIAVDRPEKAPEKFEKRPVKRPLKSVSDRGYGRVKRSYCKKLSSKLSKNRARAFANLAFSSSDEGSRFGRLECPVCRKLFFYHENLTKHVRIHEKSKRFVCVICFKVLKSKSELNGHTKKCLKKSREIPSPLKMTKNVKCGLCDETFYFDEELDEHFDSKHGDIDEDNEFTCQKCELNFDSAISLETHMKEVHEDLTKPYLCWMCQTADRYTAFAKKNLLEAHLVLIHNIPKGSIDYSKFPKITEIETEAGEGPRQTSTPLPTETETQIEPSQMEVGKNQQKNVFHCAKCSFSVKESDAFQRHILSHKVDDESIQCLECGMCFVVEPSFRRHLFMVHRIRNLDDYYSKKGYRKADEAKVDEAGVSLECSVCFTEANNSEELKVHMRTHGMAFLQAHNQTGSKSNSSEVSAAEKDKLLRKPRKNSAEGNNGVVKNVTECNVCYKKFPSQNDLKGHMLLHGIAFGRSRRKRKSSSDLDHD